MNLQDTESLLKLMKRHNVSFFKSTEVEIKMGVELSMPTSVVVEKEPTPPDIKLPQDKPDTKSAASAPPVEMEIPHHLNEVAGLLKLSDNELVDKMFPDYTQGSVTAKKEGF
jgi:hypothetical protein